MLGWLKQQQGSPQLRIDTYRGKPDITYVRLSRSDRTYERYGPSSLMADVAATGLRGRRKIFAVFYDGTLPRWESDVCGLGNSGNRPFAIVFLAQQCSYDFTETANGFYNSLVFVMAHELLHALGFVPACAPHSDGTGHVRDSKRDLMHPRLSSGVPVLDVGHDDYYRAHVRGCPDLSRSPYLVHG